MPFQVWLELSTVAPNGVTKFHSMGTAPTVELAHKWIEHNLRRLELDDQWVSIRKECRQEVPEGCKYLLDDLLHFWIDEYEDEDKVGHHASKLTSKAFLVKQKPF